MKNTQIKENKQLILNLEPIQDFFNLTPDWASHSFELYDALLAFSIEKARSIKKNGYLEYSRKFHGQKFSVTLLPALIIKKIKGENKEVPVSILPGNREDLVEKAIRKIAGFRFNAGLETDEDGHLDFTVKFKMAEIIKILKEQGHSFRKSEIEESLNVLSRCEWNITTEGQGAYSNMAAGMGGGIIKSFTWIKKKKGDSKGENYLISLSLHPLATRSIIKKSFRYLKHETILRLKNPLSRWLYSRIMHNYTQASSFDYYSYLRGDKNKGFNIKLSTIVNEYNLNHKSLKLTARLIRDSLSDLRENGVLLTRIGEENFLGFDETIELAPSTRLGGRPKIIDIKWSLFLSHNEIERIVDSNKVKKGMSPSAF